jgi:hypothetical protein
LATGPKISSSNTRIPGFTWDKTVGLKNNPSRPPPASSLAPLAMLSLTNASIREA